MKQMAESFTGTYRSPVPEHFPIKRNELALVFAFWMTYALLSIASRIFDRGFSGMTQLPYQSAVALVEALCWAALTPPIFVLASRVSADRRRSQQIVIVVAVGIVLAIVVGVLGTELRRLLAPNGGGGPSRVLDAGSAARMNQRRGPSGPPIWFGILNALVLYVGVMSAGIARAYSRRYQLRREQAARDEARLEAQLAEARLDALRRQLDPHFLFNTLNTVSALLERDPKGVRRMISRLSELLRHSFEGGGEAEVPLREELSLLNRYVEIMQVRFQGRLTVNTKVDDAALDAMIPSMILQPLVENAIKHGVELSTAPGVITLSAEVVGQSLTIRVRDNGPGLSQQTVLPERQGVGIRNTIARLEQLYHEDQSFSLSNGPGGGALVEIRLPFHLRTQ